jgi:predicted metal-dependent hydrolase
VTDIERGNVQFGGTRIDYEVDRSARRKKTVEIAFDALRGVVVSSPLTTSRSDLDAIVSRRAPWILRNVSRDAIEAPRKRLITGKSLPYLGRQVRLRILPSESARASLTFSHWSFKVLVPVPLESAQRQSEIAAVFRRWYVARATKILAERTRVWANRMQVCPAGIRVRSQNRRWASCTIDGTIQFNWRCVMIPPRLIDYVVVHELAHLLHRAHSKEFWMTVSTMLPDYQTSRALLKQAGSELVL